MIRVNDWMENNGLTNTMAGDYALEVPLCDSFGVPFHRPGGR